MQREPVWLILWFVLCLASEENQAAKTEERYQEIVRKKNLENFARAQAEELAFFCAELERLRMKNFPSLDKLKHNWAKPSTDNPILFTLNLHKLNMKFTTLQLQKKCSSNK